MQILKEKLHQKDAELLKAKKDLRSLVDIFNSQLNSHGSRLVKIGAFSYHLVPETQSLHSSTENVSFDTSTENHSINATDFYLDSF